MVVVIHSQHLSLTAAIKDFAVEHLQRPLERVWRRDGAELDIFLRDVRGGDRQGLDKECRCVFHMPGGRQFVITEVTDNIRTSIHQSRKRLLRRVRQYIDHKVQGGRHHRKHYLADVMPTTLAQRYPRSEDVRGARETLS